MLGYLLGFRVSVRCWLLGQVLWVGVRGLC